MKKQIKIPLVAIILVVILIIVAIVLLVVNLLKDPEEDVNISSDIVEDTTENVVEQLAEGLSVVPTLRDTLTSDSVWCSTFQLVWNDLKNEVAEQDIVFEEELEEVNNLNLSEFTTDMISEDYYYKKWGIKTLELKEEIEQGIYEKFGQTSDILSNFDWSDEALDQGVGDTTRYFLYCMLYRNFDFEVAFDRLENGTFADTYQDVQYFGINSDTDESVGDQVRVLYYNTEDDFAILVTTTDGDELIFAKNAEGSNFMDIYSNIVNEANSYTGDRNFQDEDELKIPYLNIDVEKEYDELEGKTFYTANGELGEINQAIQSIKFTIDETGGEIKSEAGIDATLTSGIGTTEEVNTPRYFYLDDSFVVFLKEDTQTLPYFAARIENIQNYQ